ncbi:hypothetical protein [Polaribacter sp. IC073]|uniref:hypothetical protein n=1 Tax=Polaribacter sp. IC073 TaxID=2508540 RepID=UPI0011BFD4E1|nr:hypothetical protein [Polaribacter sp. IC073]TXD47294.1 hypothetical protein ES045_11890 [Polaribacter sp. IC073]
MRYKYLIISFLFLTSCSVFFPEGITFNPANYSYNYQTFNKRLVYNNERYLLFPTSFSDSDFNNSGNLEYVINYFKDKLGNNLTLKKDFKNKEGKLIIPFLSGYDITAKEIEFLKENTTLDYVILTKTLYLKDLNDVDFPKNSKGRFYDSVSGAMSFVKIIDLKNGGILLEMNCKGEISTPENKDMYTGEIRPKPASIHTDSYNLGEKTMKKLLKKIK